MISNSIDPFTVVATMMAWVISSLAIVAGVAIVGGVAALLGGRFRMVFGYGLWALIIPVVLFIYGWLVERNECKVKKVEVVSEEVSEELDGYKIVQITDFHLKSYEGRKKAVAKVVRKINEEKADVVLFTGDLVTGDVGELEEYKEILSKIEGCDGVFSVMGNHDYMLTHNKMSRKEQMEAESILRREEESMGWTILADSAVVVRDELCIVGVENISNNTVFPSRGNLKKAMEKSEGSFKVLMMHDPSVWRKQVVGKYDVDLTLSGHTHAAQMQILGWSPSRVMYGEWRGLYDGMGKRRKKAVVEKGEQYLYVNPGLGETGFMARIGVKPEVTVFTLRRK